MKEPPSLVVVRIKTSAFKIGDTYMLRKDMRCLKRKCTGHNFLEHDVDMIGFDEVLARIINFTTVKDGIYSIGITNVKRDWETGTVDDYDYELIPYC